MGRGVGLQSAKGSSTSGYVQISLAHDNRDDKTGIVRLKNKNYELRKVTKRSQKVDKPANESKDNGLKKVLVEHDKRREIEVQVSELRDSLEDKQDRNPDEWPDKRIDEECEKLRSTLLADLQEKEKYQKAYTPRSKRSSESSK